MLLLQVVSSVFFGDKSQFGLRQIQISGVCIHLLVRFSEMSTCSVGKSTFLVANSTCLTVVFHMFGGKIQIWGW